MNQFQIANNNIHISKRQRNIDKHILGLALMFGFFMPNGNLFYLLVPVVIFILGLRFSNFNNHYNFIKIVLILLISMSFLLFGITNVDRMDVKGLLRNIVILELIFFFPFSKNVKIPNFYLYFGVIYIFISQISYILGIGSIISFFTSNYPYEGDAYYYKADYLMAHANNMSLTNRNFRLGGLYLNPNQCARYLTILFAVFLCENHKKKIKHLLPFIGITILAIVATGSRTGFLIAALMLLWFFYRKTEKSGYASKFLFISLVGFIGVFVFLSAGELSQSMRFLDFNEGVDKSLSMKIQIFIDYLSNSSLIQTLFGNFSNDGLSAIQFDSEWGDLFYRYGLLFVLAFILFYILVFRNTAPEYRLYFFILLWVISSTLVLSYRAGFVFLLCLSKYTSDLWYPQAKKWFAKKQFRYNK